MSDMSDRLQPRRAAWTNLHAERLIWLISILWLPALAAPVAALFQHPPARPLVIAILALFTVFVAVHLWAIWQDQRDVEMLQSDARPARTVWWPIVVLTSLSVLLTLLGGIAWASLFIQTSAAAARRLPIGLAARTLGGLIILMFLAGRLTAGASLGDFLNGLFYVVLVGFTVAGVISAIVTNRDLRAARQELARLAVTEERLRIARDLHDLLGHSLSLIALKSELAGRLLAAAPDRAAEEILDVETTARSALHEVREAVSAYRQPTLASELDGARELLSAAGIACAIDAAESATHALPPAIESTLAWAVREGVTNVVRHSRAHSCRILLSRGAGEVAVAVVDDGQCGDAITPPASRIGGGNGLRGLAERVRTLGGRQEAGPYPEGGFRLTVTLPLTRRRDAQPYAASYDAPSIAVETAGETAGIAPAREEGAER